MSRKRFTLFGVLLIASSLQACASGRRATPPSARKPPPAPTTLPAGGVVDPSLAAEYYTGDGLGYNLVLSLRDDGTFSCKWTGCLGDYGDATGVWSRSADRVSFVSRDATGMLADYLRGATVVDGGEFPALVLDQRQRFYQKHGLSRYAALQRTSVPQN